MEPTSASSLCVVLCCYGLVPCRRQSEFAAEQCLPLILVVVRDGKGEVAPTKGAEDDDQLTSKTAFKVFGKQWVRDDVRVDTGELG